LHQLIAKSIIAVSLVKTGAGDLSEYDLDLPKLARVREHNANRSADQSLAFRADLKAQSKRRRERLSLLASAPPLMRRNDLLPPLAVEEVSSADLVNPARNVRRQDAAHIREVVASIAALGFCDPVLIGSGNTILDGVIRVEAAKQLGLPKIPCIRVQHLTSAEQRLLRLASNRLAEKGGWNLEDLKIEFEEFILEESPIEISGFSAPERDQILLGDDPPPHEQGPLAPAPGAIAVARGGDIFRLGDHRIVCGDATAQDVFASLMQSEGPARLVLTDEPYNVRICGNVTGGSHREFAMASGEMSGPKFLTFNLAWMKAALEHLADGGLFGTFIDWRGLPAVHTAATQLGLVPINLIVWAKTNAGMGSLYRSQHELLPLFKKGKGDHLNNIDLGRKGRWRSNLWVYPGASSIGSDSRQGLRDHPTVKPTALLADALLDVTARGDIVIDPFLGSGSMLIAAERTGRRCRGVEIDPLYVDVIVRRYQAETGRDAILEATGETFTVLTARRHDEQAGGDDGEG
jgi:DNA modification methylase